MLEPTCSKIVVNGLNVVTSDVVGIDNSISTLVYPHPERTNKEYQDAMNFIRGYLKQKEPPNDINNLSIAF